MAPSVETWDVHGHYLPETAFPLMSDGPTPVAVSGNDGTKGSIAANGVPVGATVEQLSSVELILESMDKAGLDVRVLTPPPFTYRYWSTSEAGVELCRIINDATAQVVEAHPDRFVGLCTVPMQDPVAAIEELRRGVNDLGLVGLGVGTNVDGHLLSDPIFRTVFRECADLDLPILVHPDFVPSPRYREYYLINILGMPVETGTTVANMILSGMLAELPTLRVCFVHGGGVAPYLFGRWAHSWRARQDTSRDTDQAPSDFMGSLYWDSLTHSPEALAYLVNVVGEDKVVIGTDAPFDMEDDAPLRTLDEAPGLTDSQRRTITSVAPLRWLRGPESA